MSDPRFPPPQPGYPLPRVRPSKDVGVAYPMMLFMLVGICGVQHFYLGEIGRRLLWLATFGLLGIGVVVDLFTLPAQTRRVNGAIVAGIR